MAEPIYERRSDWQPGEVVRILHMDEDSITIERRVVSPGEGLILNDNESVESDGGWWSPPRHGFWRRLLERIVP